MILRNQILGPGLTIHICHQVGQLGAGIQQLFQRLDLGGDRRRAEIIHRFKRDIHGQIALTRQSVRHGKGRARGHRLHPVIEIVDVDLQKLAVCNGGLFDLGLARQIAHDAHDKRQLYLFLGTVQFNIIFDLNPRSPVPGYEFL